MLLLSALGPREAKALRTEPTFYVDSLLYRAPAQQPLTSPIIFPAVTSVGQARTLYVKIARAPHETSEPALLTDKTFTWGFTLTYDTSMFKIASVTTDVTEEPPTVTTAAQFLKRRIYTFDTDPFSPTYNTWYVSGFYGTSFGKGETTPGVLTVGNTLVSPDPTTVALPAEYSAPDTGPTAPDKGRHAGSNYDLPYTENATQAVLQLDGATTVTDPSYCLLAIIKLTSVAVPTADYVGSAFHLSDVGLLEYDGKTDYFASSGGTTMDGAYVKIPPPIPEFPLGLAPILMLAPAIPIVYLWRTRKKQVMNK